MTKNFSKAYQEENEGGLPGQAQYTRLYWKNYMWQVIFYIRRCHKITKNIVFYPATHPFTYHWNERDCCKAFVLLF